MDTTSDDWVADCLKWRGVVLTGKHAHWCADWDFLPMDETCENEWPCACCAGGACEVAPTERGSSGKPAERSD